MPQVITRFEEIPRRQGMLAWIGYPNATQKFCFAYPQWTKDGDSFVKIEKTAFPERGCIYTGIMGMDDAASVRNSFGEIAVITINTEDLDNPYYGDEGVNDVFSSRLSLSNPYSDLSFSQLKTHPLSRDLIQIVELEDPSIRLDKPLHEPVGLILGQSKPTTQLIMIERVEGSSLSYYGPFTAQQTSRPGEFELDATDQHRRRIFKLDSSEIGDVITVTRQHYDMGTAAKFMDRAVLNALAKRSSSVMIDWVTDDELIEALGNVLRSAQNLKMKPETIRAAKKAIADCNMANAGLYMTDQRKHRMDELLSQPQLWTGKIDLISAALARPEASDQLIELALSETYFPRIKDLFVDSEALQEQVELEKQRFALETEKARKLTEEANAAKAQAEKELEEGRAKVQAMRDEALNSVKEELDRTKEELAQAAAELEVARTDLSEVEKLADAAISQIDDSADKIAGQLAERRVLLRLNGGVVHASSQGQIDSSFTPTPAPLPREAEAELSEWDVFNVIHEQLVENAGRALSGEQIINLLTCLMGSSITVFSGMPGTGKTSLANALAGALGLRQTEKPRYTMIPVERGWTSHRDYIGYYNPLSNRLEAANTTVMQAVRTLDAEGIEGMNEQTVPYLMLLDEANLSVVENYWSPFLSNADEFLTRPTELNMQGGPILSLPSNMRWIATVNYDHTTEALSERFLNRAWVINVGTPDKLSLDDLLRSSEKSDFDDVIPFSYQKLMSIFGPKENALIEDTMAKRLLSTVFSVCSARNTPVSYRCQRAIANYVATAEPLMREMVPSAGACAVDFAIAQRVLPSINGVGDQTRSLLNALKEVSPLLEVTNQRIEHMLRVGDSDGFYQFFA